MSTDPYRICPVCFRDRRTRKGVMLQHKRWSKSQGKMIDCPGSWCPPATRQQLIQVGFKRVWNKLCYSGKTMIIALIVATIGGIITFAVKTSAKIGWLPWLNVHAAGVVMFIVGLIFAAAYSTPHYHRWRERD